jgi:hypothetical protein
MFEAVVAVWLPTERAVAVHGLQNITTTDCWLNAQWRYTVYRTSQRQTADWTHSGGTRFTEHHNSGVIEDPVLPGCDPSPLGSRVWGPRIILHAGDTLHRNLVGSDPRSVSSHVHIITFRVVSPWTVLPPSSECTLRITDNKRKRYY